MHDTIPGDLEVEAEWTRASDRAADLRVRAWLLADEIYRQRGLTDDLLKRKQCLEEMWRHCRVERRHWPDQASSVLRRLRSEIAWMRYHADTQRWGLAEKNQLQFEALISNWLELRSPGGDAPLPAWLPASLEQICVAATDAMIEADLDHDAWSLLWRQVSLEKQLRTPQSSQVQANLHRISLRRHGQLVSDGPNLPASWRLLHAALAFGLGVSKEHTDS